MDPSVDNIDGLQTKLKVDVLKIVLAEMLAEME